MRVFDIVGIVFVALWIGAVAAFVLVADDDDVEGIPLTDGVVDLREDTLWMAVYRDNEEVGMLREDRTRLLDGWLVEVQGVAELALMGDSQAFRFESRTTLDEELTVRSATGTIEAFGRRLDLTGQFIDDDSPTFQVDLTLDEASDRFLAKLEKRPRLVSHAIPEIIASDDLEPGDRFREEFLDPMTLSPTDLEITYEGREVIDTHEGPYESYDFVQSVGHFDMRLFVDSRGMPIFQALPMSVVVRRIPDEIGPSQYRQFNEKLEDAIDQSPPFVDNISAEDLLSVVSRFGGGQLDRLEAVDDAEELLTDAPGAPTGDEDDTEPLEVEITSIPEEPRLQLMTPRQHVAIHTSDNARVQTGDDNPLWHAGQSPENSSYEPVADPEDVVTLTELVDKLSAEFDGERSPPISPATLADAAADICADARTAPLDTDGEWPAGPVDDLQTYADCLALIADAFVSLGVTPHFAHGAVWEGDRFRPHVWLALYINGEHLGEFDPAVDSRPSTNHLQLYLNDRFDPQPLAELTEHLQLR